MTYKDTFQNFLNALQERELTVLNNGKASLEISDSCWLDTPITPKSLEEGIMKIREDFLSQVDDLLFVVNKYKESENDRK